MLVLLVAMCDELFHDPFSFGFLVPLLFLAVNRFSEYMDCLILVQDHLNGLRIMLSHMLGYPRPYLAINSRIFVLYTGHACEFLRLLDTIGKKFIVRFSLFRIELADDYFIVSASRTFTVCMIPTNLPTGARIPGLVGPQFRFCHYYCNVNGIMCIK